MKKRRTYEEAFKISTVEIIEKEKYSLSEAEIRFGINKSVLAQWRRIYKKREANGGDGLSLHEQKQMRKELERVRRERDILKEALAYFAANQ